MATFNLLLIDNSDSFKPYLTGLLRIRYKDLILYSAQNLKQIAAIAKKTSFEIVLADTQFLNSMMKSSEYEQLFESLKNATIIVLYLKETKSAQIQAVSEFFPNLRLLQKPFKPASLYHIIDSIIEQTQTQNSITEINLPAWANQDNFNLRVLCQNFRNDRDKVIKILKLYPSQIKRNLISIEQAYRQNQREKLIIELQSLKTSLTYFANESIVAMIDSIRQLAENPTADNFSIEQLLAKFKSQWETLQRQIQEL